MPGADTSDLEKLIDKQTCAELIMRYCRALDWVDEAALRTIFWPDAEIDFGFFKGRGEQFVPEIIKIERSLTRRSHLTSAPLIRIEGDMAEGECYVLAAGVAVADGRAHHDIFGGRYLDRFARRGGEWRIARRVFALDWQRSFDTEAGVENPLVPGLNWSDGFNPDHPLYRKL